jgi:hypothetical protein
MSAGGRRGQGGSKGGQGRVTRREDEGNKYAAGAQTMSFGPPVRFGRNRRKVYLFPLISLYREFVR